MNFYFLSIVYRNRKRQKSKSLVRNSVNKRPTAMKTRANKTIRTRHLRSSSASDISTSAIVSPLTTDENNDVDSLSNKINDFDQPVQIIKSESNEKDLFDSSKESDQEEDQSVLIEKPQLDDSIREYLWQPTRISTTTTTTTTITEVTDQNGVTVLIRELNDMQTSNISRTPRFLGYGNGGRGGKH
jgi:hypothetical protein